MSFLSQARAQMREQPAKHLMQTLFLLGLVVIVLGLVAGCGSSESDERELTSNASVNLMDWHIAGLWVINSPVAWVRVCNNNSVPIKEITFQYNTYDINGKPLDQGTYTIEGAVPAHSSKNFIELYVGLVDLYSEQLSVKLLSVHKG